MLTVQIINDYFHLVTGYSSPYPTPCITYLHASVLCVDRLFTVGSLTPLSYLSMEKVNWLPNVPRHI